MTLKRKIWRIIEWDVVCKILYFVVLCMGGVVVCIGDDHSR